MRPEMRPGCFWPPIAQVDRDVEVIAKCIHGPTAGAWQVNSKMRVTVLAGTWLSAPPSGRDQLLAGELPDDMVTAQLG
jgi:hypothetical protein